MSNQVGPFFTREVSFRESASICCETTELDLPLPNRSVGPDDELVVGSLQIAGDDPQAAQVRALLDGGRSLTGTGARWVLVERDAGGEVPDGALSGLTRIYAGTTLDLYANPQSTPEPAPDPAPRYSPL